MIYLEAYRQLHRHGMFKGFSLEKHINKITELLKEHGCKSVLDYGCGKAILHIRGITKEWGNVSLYDPAVDEFEKLPEGKFDAVICTDVLEHVPEQELDQTLQIIFSKATKLVCLNISTKEAKKFLPNGINAHVTVRPSEWWLGKLDSYRQGQVMWVNFDA